MLETTLLVVSGKKLTVPRLLKRILQVAIAVALTAAVFLVVIVGNGLLVGRQASLQAGINLWLAFIKRPDILATMVLTALVTVLFVYWQRNQERRAGSADRMHRSVTRYPRRGHQDAQSRHRAINRACPGIRRIGTRRGRANPASANQRCNWAGG